VNGSDNLEATERPDIAGRLARLRSSVIGIDGDIDAILVSHLTNVRYLTGFTGSAGVLLVTADGATLITDGRYTIQAADQLADAGVTCELVIESEAPLKRLSDVVRSADANHLGLEAQYVPWSTLMSWESAFDGVDLVPTSDAIEALRIIKDAGELAVMKRAAAIADDALEDVRSLLADRPTEKEFGLELDTAMRRLGADDVSFETIVASGPNAARPHHRPGHRTIAAGDLVILDFGALVDGYHSDMSRTFCIGEPTPIQARMLTVVAEAQAAGASLVGPGVAARDIDAVCRERIAEAGWADAFTHGTGHGVGLDIHEAPRVGRTSDATLAPGHVVTVEPGVYLEEHGGVRIEDTLVVSIDGAEVLTRSPKLTTV